MAFAEDRKRRDTIRRIQLVVKSEAKLLALEHRVACGEIVEATDIAKAVATILARSAMGWLFNISDVAGGPVRLRLRPRRTRLRRAARRPRHPGHPFDRSVADAAQVLAAYGSLQVVEKRFRVIEDFLGLRPIYVWTESRARGHIATCVLAAVIETLLGNTTAEAMCATGDIDT